MVSYTGNILGIQNQIIPFGALFLTSTEGKGGNHAGCSRNVQVSWTQAKVNNVIPDTGTVEPFRYKIIGRL